MTLKAVIAINSCMPNARNCYNYKMSLLSYILIRQDSKISCKSTRFPAFHIYIFHYTHYFFFLAPGHWLAGRTYHALFFSHISIIFCHPLSQVCLLFCDPLTVDRPSPPLGCGLDRLCLCVKCECVWIASNPHGGLYAVLTLSVCHCYTSFVPLSSSDCVFMPMKVCIWEIHTWHVFLYWMRVCRRVYPFCQDPAPFCVCLLCPVLCSVALGIWPLQRTMPNRQYSNNSRDSLWSNRIRYLYYFQHFSAHHNLFSYTISANLIDILYCVQDVINSSYVLAT